MAIYSALTLRDGLYVGNVGDYTNKGTPYYISVDINNISQFDFDRVKLYNNSSDFDANSSIIANGVIASANLTSTGVNSWETTIQVPNPQITDSNIIFETVIVVNFIINNSTGSYIISDDFNSASVDNNINTGMGDAYYEEDLTTNVKKYFAEAFKFDGSQFEMDGDRIVGLKQSFIDSLATDVTGLLKAKGLDVGSDGLTIEDGQGHKHKLHLGN